MSKKKNSTHLEKIIKKKIIMKHTINEYFNFITFESNVFKFNENGKNQFGGSKN